MPISGKFEADFTSFTAAVAQAEVSLKNFEADGAKVETRLTNVSNALSGVKVIQQATIAAEAVTRLGEAGGTTAGLLKLTDAELARVGATALEAQAKFQALGQTAPAAIQEIAKAATDLAEKQKEGGGQLGDFAGALGGLVTKFLTAEGAIELFKKAFDFTKEAVANAAALEDLSRATGITTDGLQRLSYVGAEFGVDTETMARGVEQLSTKLAHGDKNATEAVEALGLSVKTLIAAGPKEAFLEVAEAAGRLDDPMTKAATAADLFGGKLGKQLVPMLGQLREKMDEVPKDAIISESTIKSAHDFEVELAHLETRMKAFTANTFGVVYAGWRSLMGDDAAVIAAAIDKINAKADETAAANKKVGASIGEVTAGWGKVAPAADAAATGGISNADRLALHLKSLTRDALAPLNAEEKKYLDAAMAANETTADSAKWLGASEAAIKRYEDAQKAAAEAVKKHTEAVTALEEKIRNTKADEEARNLAEAVAKLGGASKLSADDQKRLADEVGKLWKEGAKLDPLLVDLAVRFGELDPKVTEGTAAFEHLGETIKTITLPAAVLINAEIDALQKKITAGFSGMGEIGEKVGDGFKEGAKTIEEAAARDIRAMGQLGQAFNQVASIAQSTGHATAASALSSFGGIANGLHQAAAANKEWSGSAGIASALFSSHASTTEKAAAGISSGLAIAGGAMNVWAATANAGGKAAGAFKGAMAGAEAGSAFGPWGAAVGAAAGALTGFIRNLTAGRKAVEDFAKSQGGFDALHAQLDALPTGQGETLWKQLTQGTAKGDPKAAQAAIDKITAALAAADKATAQFDTDAGNVFQQIQSFGGNIDASMLPYLNDLAKAGKLSADNVALLGKMSGDGKPTYQQLDTLAKKYNLTLDQMGQGFQGAKIHDEFQSLIDDMDELQRGGVDLGAVLTTTGADGKLALSDLGTSVQNVIDQSMKYGQDVPENMKPAAQALIDQGLLLDANGNKITDINQIKFGESMQTSLETLNKTLKDLIDSLHTLSGTTATPTIAPRYVPPSNAPADTPAPAYGGAQAAGGDYYVTKPTYFLAGEAGPEAVSFGGANGTRGGRTASTVPIHVHVMMPDGRTLAEVVVPHIPVVVQEYGLTR
jgi:hypothetical protein